MKRRLRTLAAVVSIVLMGGCFGQFALVRNLYEFNESIENDYARSVVLWAMLIVPVYELAALGDFWILNVIEFWTGDNPVDLPDEPGATVRMRQASRELLQLNVAMPDGRVEQFELVRLGERAGAVRGADGRILSSAEWLADGSLVITANETVRVVLPSDVQALAAHVGSGGLLSAARDLLWGERVVARR